MNQVGNNLVLPAFYEATPGVLRLYESHGSAVALYKGSRRNSRKPLADRPYAYYSLSGERKRKKHQILNVSAAPFASRELS